MMKILVCVKQVPDTTNIKWTENNTIQREGLESVMNPFDIFAVEEALKIKNKRHNVSITTLTMGPNQAIDMLKKTIARGCDSACLLTDRKFAGADTYATSKTIASAIRTKYADFNLIICGQFAVDGDTAQTGPAIANNLKIPQVTYVKEIVDANEFHVTVRRELEEGIETVQVKLPALICVLQGDYEPSPVTINGVKKALKTEIDIYSADNIDIAAEDAGLKGSPTYVSKAFRPVKKHECVFVENSSDFCNELKECLQDE
ncbi:electron transfer flavoprotein subunit beta/FixA family protein [bacterium]|nr:electron transfer flavoprotein subunit beta/FixA family protein [bacterium]